MHFHPLISSNIGSIDGLGLRSAYDHLPENPAVTGNRATSCKGVG